MNRTDSLTQAQRDLLAMGKCPFCHAAIRGYCAPVGLFAPEAYLGYARASRGGYRHALQYLWHRRPLVHLPQLRVFPPHAPRWRHERRPTLAPLWALCPNPLGPNRRMRHAQFL